MQSDSMHDRICGHCGSRAFRVALGGEEPALACRYCGKIALQAAANGESQPERLRPAGVGHSGPALSPVGSR
jgi:hypothetical protein